MEEGIQGCNYGSFQIEICLKRKSGYSTQVRVNDMLIFIGDEETTIPIWTKRYDDTFNKIAITEKYNRFNVTVLLKPETKKKIIDHLNDNCKIIIDMKVELVSASYVSTQMKCRGDFIKSNSDNLENNFKLSGKEPMCFWGGNIAELREIMSYDEMELDKIGDRKTALFLIMSDTDTTFNFVIAMLQSQLFNLLCDKADDEYGGRLPVHVRVIADEFANIGQIPQFDKLIATIRSREISASIILQSQSQLKAMYKDSADTILGNCDTTLFLGGKRKPH